MMMYSYRYIQETNWSFMKSKMTTKGNKCLASKGNVYEREVSRLLSPASHMGFFPFSMPKFHRYVLSREMEASKSIK